MSTPPVVTADNHGASRSKPNAPSTSTKLTGDEIADVRRQRDEQTAIFKQLITKTPDFPKPGILFEDIFPIFTSPKHHEALILSFELAIREIIGSTQPPDVIVGLDARGFLIGPTLALRLGASFVPVRKAGKLPGKLQTAKYIKEYGEDTFAMQDAAIPAGSRVVVVDDLIATGGSASAAGELVRKCGGDLIGYVFVIGLVGLNGKAKLGDVPVYALIESQL